MLKRRIQDLTVCFTYNFSCLHPQNRSQKDFRNQYQLREEIQRGGFGIVYKAYRIRDGLPVAVKYVEHKNIREWTMYENQLIPTEICHLELCANIRGVVNLVDWFASSKGFMIIMERPEKCMDLFDVITLYGRLDEDVARWIFVQIVDAVLEMKNLHSLVHRDIKDENIIVNMETGEAKLVDFGAADFLDSALKKHFQGTRSYCPPEYFKQKDYLPLEATSWSLGILLYTMVVGRVPFRNEIQTCLGCLHFPDDVSQGCQNLIRKCLSVTPKRRLTFAEIRAHSWSNNNPSLNYSGAFSSLLRRRSVQRGNWHRTRRRRQNSVAWSLSDATSESEDEPALRRSFLLPIDNTATAPSAQSIPQLVSRPSTPNCKNDEDGLTQSLELSVYDPLPQYTPTKNLPMEDFQLDGDVEIIVQRFPPPLQRYIDEPEFYSTTRRKTSEQSVQNFPSDLRKNPKLREILARQQLQRRREESFEMYHSVSSNFSSSRYESLRSNTLTSDDNASVSQQSAYFSAHDDSLDNVSLPSTKGDRRQSTTSATPSADTNTEIGTTPASTSRVSLHDPATSSPFSSTQAENIVGNPRAHKSLAATVQRTFSSGVRRAKSLRVSFRQRDKSSVATKNVATTTSDRPQSLPVKVVQQLAANSYDTLVALSARMADNSEDGMADERCASRSSSTGDCDQTTQKSRERQTRISTKVASSTPTKRRQAMSVAPSRIGDSSMPPPHKLLTEIVAVRRQKLLLAASVNDENACPHERRSKSRDSKTIETRRSPRYETRRFPLAVFDICAQQLPMLEQVAK